MTPSGAASQAVSGSPARQEAEGAFVELRGELFYRISHCDAMPEFLMSIVSASDHYLFISSNGGLTAGRRNPDNALFPYYTDDRIHDSAEHTGSKTILRVRRVDGFELWEPFSIRHAGRVTRNLYKSTCGNKIVFEEVNRALGLSFSYEWATSGRFGFVRTSRLKNESASPQSIEVLDGLQNLLPGGISRRFQLEYSTLVDGYKRTELDMETGLAILQLTSVPVDRPEPSEALLANTAWCTGLERPLYLLSSVQLDRFRDGGELCEEHESHGRRSAFFVNASIQLLPSATRTWRIVADVSQDTAAVHSLRQVIRQGQGLETRLQEDVERGTESLLQIVGSSDGLQQTREQANIWRHFSSALFNVMRGGIPAENYWVTKADFSCFMHQINKPLAHRQEPFLESLPERLTKSELEEKARATGDPDLERISLEYLPLTFSRRHGDPSRPWNIFDIRLHDEHGNRALNYEGNWRDIFQNWEALSWSYPRLTLGMLFKFLDSTTADGYNPYRVSRNGYEWEVLEPYDSWSYLGYWGDHQIAYLLRLMEQAQRSGPSSLPWLLKREVFTYADVPYRIKPYAALLKDLRNSIDFDAAAHEAVMQRAARIGADGKALAGVDGSLVHANLAEKLLVPLLAKLSNFIPEAGIWLNTQRPEWNDANNALAGAGTSVITVSYMRRFACFVRELLASSDEKQLCLSKELAELVQSLHSSLNARISSEERLGDRARKALLDALGEAGSCYREAIYHDGFSGERVPVPVTEVTALLDAALHHFDRCIRANRRADGLYHAYNTVEFSGDGIQVHRLPLMLEGQVAVLSSGALSAAEVISLLDALRQSALYRPDQNSYTLHPAREQRSFLDKNNIALEDLAKSRLLKRMLADEDRRIVVADTSGGVHFRAELRNAEELRRALAAIAEAPLAKVALEETELLCALYEKIFQHRFFLGRAQTMYKYEGNGCIYWHMVSKLLLAVREVLTQSVLDGADEVLLQRLRAHYCNIRAGLGTSKSPSQYGAVPIDPYSHTPDFIGAQQPGMTGQVKEDFIARLGEMGVVIRNGEVSFIKGVITADEFLTAPAVFAYFDVNGSRRELELAPQTLAFTLCQVPVVAHRSGPAQIAVSSANGKKHTLAGCSLGPEVSAKIFARSGEIERLDVFFDFEASAAAASNQTPARQEEKNA